jgi:hypothetical protein
MAPMTKSILPVWTKGTVGRAACGSRAHAERPAIGGVVDVEADDLVLLVELAEGRRRRVHADLDGADLTISSSVR